MQEEEKTIPVNDSPEIAAILEECYKHTEVFCRTLFANNFFKPFTSIHKPIFEQLDAKKKQKRLAIAGTRGIGKTTLARARAAKAILFAEYKFIVYIGKSATHAEMQTENLKKDLMASRDVRDIFGSIKTKTVRDVDDSWSKKTWVASVGEGEDRHYTLVLPRGSGQQIRGLLWVSPNGENLRPDLVICDDMEDPLTIDNENIRAATSEWFFADVMFMFSQFDDNWEVFYIDTIKHEDCFLALLMDKEKSPEWSSLTCAICDENYRSLAPDFKTDEDIQKMVELYRNKHMMDVFAREVQCIPISKEDAVFKSDMFKYYSEADKDFTKRLPNIINVVIVDPAKKAKATSAKTGLVVWGIDVETNMLYMRYAASDHFTPERQVDEAFELAARYRARVIGVESTGSGEYVTHPYMNEAIRSGLGLEVIELQARKGQDEFSGPQGGKKMRIASLQHFYRRGLVKHNIQGCGAYETQLLGFPKSKEWDIMDAAGYITEMLDKGGIFFAMTGMKEEKQESVESEYTELAMDDYAGVDVSNFYEAAP
jgi:hypothetical protein